MKKNYVVIFLTSLLITVGTSCTYNELEDRIVDLEKDIKRMETILGHNEPMNTSIITTTTDNQPIHLNLSYKLKQLSQNYIRKSSDSNHYTIVISRDAQVGQNYYSYAAISYDPVNKIAEPILFELMFEKSDGNLYYGYFSHASVETFKSTVSEFNLETGKISVSLTLTTASNSEDNLYQEKSMTITSSFEGHLNIIKGDSQ
jgi:hypothetical protein